MTDFYTDRAQTLALLGGGWPGYGRRSEVASYAAGVGRLLAERMDDVRYLVAACGRKTIGLRRTDRWYKLTLRREDLEAGSVVQYGEGRQYGDGLNYGAVQPNVWRVAKPAKLAHVEFMTSSITHGEATFHPGQDFEITATQIGLFFDPFADPRLPVETILGDDPTDEVTLWLANAAFDFKDPYTQFGYVFGVDGDNTRHYLDAVNAVYDAAIEGPSEDVVRRLVAASFGCDVVRRDAETVELVFDDGRWLWIVTDAEVYQFRTGLAASVAAGDVVHKGDTLTDAIQFGDFRKGVPPTWLAQATLPREWLGDAYIGGLTFGGADVPLAFADGAASFALGGHPLDVAAFWAKVAANGAASDKTFAQYLDVRAVPSEPTTAATLPATINPLAFAAANLLRNNAVAVMADADGLTGDGLDVLRLLRDVLPLGRLVLLVIRYRIDEEPVTVDDASGPTSVDASESHVIESDTQNVPVIEDEAELSTLGASCI
jgi:hypothetical protein